MVWLAWVAYFAYSVNSWASDAALGPAPKAATAWPPSVEIVTPILIGVGHVGVARAFELAPVAALAPPVGDLVPAPVVGPAALPLPLLAAPPAPVPPMAPPESLCAAASPACVLPPCAPPD